MSVTLLTWKGFSVSSGNYSMSASKVKFPIRGDKSEAVIRNICSGECMCGEVSLPVPGMGSPVPSKTPRADTLCCLGKQTKINRRENVLLNLSLFQYFILIISDFKSNF